MGSVESRYLAPEPLLAVKASSAAKAAFNIDEWRIFRGQGGVYLTGYDANGKAVKGIATVYSRAADGSIDKLLTRVNDGSSFIAGHALARNTTLATQPLSADSQAFVRRAALDLARLRKIAEARLRASNQGTAAAAALCNQQMLNMVLNPLTCLDAPSGNPTAIAHCAQVLTAANGSGSTCVGLARPQGSNGLGVQSIDQLNAASCRGDSDCLAAFGFFDGQNRFDDRCLASGARGCGGAAGTTPIWAPSFNSLNGSTPSSTSSSVSSPTNFKCVAGDCAAFQSGMGSTNFTCVSGDCGALKSGTGGFTCVSGDCNALKSGGTNQQFSCVSGDCAAFKPNDDTIGNMGNPFDGPSDAQKKQAAEDFNNSGNPFDGPSDAQKKQAAEDFNNSGNPFDGPSDAQKKQAASDFENSGNPFDGPTQAEKEQAAEQVRQDQDQSFSGMKTDAGDGNVNFSDA
jgi:hypothetical protein